MAYKFNIKDMKKLDSPQRRKMLPPKKTLEELGLKKGNTVADIGCGIGYFTIPASEVVSPNPVFALDPSQEMLDYLMANNTSENIMPIKTNAYDFKIEESSVDFALMSNVFHEIDDKDRFVHEISRIIKTGGSLAIIEWQKKDMEKGPDLAHRISPGELTEFFKSGFEIEKVIDFAGILYGAVFKAY